MPSFKYLYPFLSPLIISEIAPANEEEDKRLVCNTADFMKTDYCLMTEYKEFNLNVSEDLFEYVKYPKGKEIRKINKERNARRHRGKVLMRRKPPKKKKMTDEEYEEWEGEGMEELKALESDPEEMVDDILSAPLEVDVNGVFYSAVSIVNTGNVLASPEAKVLCKN